jgi:hypothetical protein
MTLPLKTIEKSKFKTMFKENSFKPQGKRMLDQSVHSNYLEFISLVKEELAPLLNLELCNDELSLPIVTIFSDAMKNRQVSVIGHGISYLNLDFDFRERFHYFWKRI